MGRNSEAEGEREREELQQQQLSFLSYLSHLWNFFSAVISSLLFSCPWLLPSPSILFFLQLIPFLPTIWNLFPVLKMSRTRKLSLKIHFTKQCTTCQLPSFFPAISFHYTFQISLPCKASFPLNFPLTQFSSFNELSNWLALCRSLLASP